MKRLILVAAAAFVLPIGMPSSTEARVLPDIESSRTILPIQARDPVVHERRNGRLEVRFRSGCRMIFTRAGRPVDAQKCSRRQEAQASDAVSRHLRRHGDAVRRTRRGPQINELRGGRLQVVFRSGCRMIFNRRGRPIDAQRCSHAQEARASDAVASYMRRRDRDRRTRRAPQINELRGGRLQVVFRSGCRMMFNRRGRPIDAQRCSHAQERRANDAVTAYIRRHGRRGRLDRRGRRGPHLIEHRNGRLEVVFPSGCKVHFNRRGRAVDAQRCSRSQESTARKMAAHYLAARRRR